MQFQHSGPGCLCFFSSPQFCKHCGQENVVDAVARIRLHRLVRSVGSQFITSAPEVAERKGTVSSESPGIEWTQTHSSCRPVDRPFGFSRPAEDYTAKDIGK